MLSQEQIEFFKQERMKHVNALEIISIKAQQMAEQYRSQMAVEEKAIENYNEILAENSVDLNESEISEELVEPLSEEISDNSGENRVE